ncbi:hypothetical protein T08_10116 [Trichinella sp. T8]|nr:hypothetical protein T08_10116 [Trichinella sp. T8]
MDSARYNFQTDTHTYTPHKASQSRLVQSCAYVAGARGQVTQLAYLIAGTALASLHRHLLESINPTVRSCLQQAHIFSAKTGFSNSCILSTKGMPPSETGV